MVDEFLDSSDSVDIVAALTELPNTCDPNSQELIEKLRNDHNETDNQIAINTGRVISKNLRFTLRFENSCKLFFCDLTIT